MTAAAMSGVGLKTIPSAVRAEFKSSWKAMTEAIEVFFTTSSVFVVSGGMTTFTA